MIGLAASSCTHLELIHVPLDDKACLVERFTETEKRNMSDAVGRKILKNKILCEQLVKSHNEHHNDS